MPQDSEERPLPKLTSMSWDIRRPILLAILVALQIAGCGESVAELVNGGREPSASVKDFLASNDLEFHADLAPPDAISADAVIAKLRADGWPPFAENKTPDVPIFGFLTCLEGKPCQNSLVGDRTARLRVWIVDYPFASGGNGGTAWAIVDGDTGGLIVGDGPPGG